MKDTTTKTNSSTLEMGYLVKISQQKSISTLNIWPNSLISPQNTFHNF
ncbi:hypothetical protein HanHA89_Chr05g0181171 [Helianthus annuus]|nr:hypothetical protein HanHA89_Chr05g0181171 [Helianthus annuus]